MKPPLLRTKGLYTGYRNSSGKGGEITRNFSAEIFAGEMVCLLGGNGSGKSTLLRTLGGFLSPLEGRIFLEGRPLDAYTSPERARKIGVVHTANPPVPYMTVEDLVLTGRHPYTAWHGKVSSEDREIRDRTLHFLGLRNLRKRRVEELSDGERRRAWLGRALAQKTPLLLLDEPLAFIDLPGGAEILSLLRRPRGGGRPGHSFLLPSASRGLGKGGPNLASHPLGGVPSGIGGGSASPGRSGTGLSR